MKTGGCAAICEEEGNIDHVSGLSIFTDLNCRNVHINHMHHDHVDENFSISMVQGIPDKPVLNCMGVDGLGHHSGDYVGHPVCG